MSNVITGVIQEIRKKQVAGGKNAYDIVVAGKAYGNGLYPPKASEGDYVKFEVDNSRGYDNVARGTLKVNRNKPPAEAVAEAEATAPQKNSAGASFDARQDVISRQAAANTAVAFMAVAAQADALGLPKTDTKGQRIAALEAMLQKYTEQFYEANTGVKFKSIAPNAPAEAEEEQEEEAAPEDEEWS